MDKLTLISQIEHMHKPLILVPAMRDENDMEDMPYHFHAWCSECFLDATTNAGKKWHEFYDDRPTVLVVDIIELAIVVPGSKYSDRKCYRCEDYRWA